MLAIDTPPLYNDHTQKCVYLAVYRVCFEADTDKVTNCTVGDRTLVVPGR